MSIHISELQDKKHFFLFKVFNLLIVLNIHGVNQWEQSFLFLKARKLLFKIYNNFWGGVFKGNNSFCKSLISEEVQTLITRATNVYILIPTTKNYGGGGNHLVCPNILYMQHLLNPSAHFYDMLLSDVCKEKSNLRGYNQVLCLNMYKYMLKRNSYYTIHWILIQFLEKVRQDMQISMKEEDFCPIPTKEEIGNDRFYTIKSHCKHYF